MLKQLTPDLWIAESRLRFVGTQLGTRMTIIRLPDGSLFLHSPIGLTAELRCALDAVGTPRFAVAPNRFHHLYASQYSDAYPQLQLFVAPGLETKRPDLRYTGVLDDTAPPGWAAHVDQVVVRGYPILNEVVFCHRASHTLLTADLVFNIREDSPWLTRLAFRLFGGYDHFGPTWLERFLVRDRAAARASLNRILSWEFDRVILAHGQVLERGGREALRSGYAWLN